MRVGKRICIALYIIAAASAVCYAVMRLSTGFAEFFNRTVGAAARRVYTGISDLVPFSIAEAAVALVPVFAVLVVVWIVKRMKRHGAAGCRRVIATLFAVLSFLGTSFVLTEAAGYFSVPMEERLGLGGELTKDELYAAAKYLAMQIGTSSFSGGFEKYESGATVMPYSVGESARKTADLYGSFRDRFGFPDSFYSNPKILVSSPLVTYTHISGIYCDYTGEININVNYPDYVVVSTVAHEMAHQRGISPENEANFMAYAVLSESDDEYLRYAGCLDAWTTVSKYLYKADPDAYFELRELLGETANAELAAYSEFFSEYKTSSAAEVTEKVNDTYLKSQGTSGTVSYDESAYLIVKYILKYQTEIK